MLNVLHTLEHLGFNAGCYTEAVQQVRERLGKHKITEAQKLIKELLDVDASFNDPDIAEMTCQAIVEDAIRHGGDAGFDANDALQHAIKRATNMKNNLANKWMFAKPEGYSSTPTITEQREIITGQTTEVAVNAQGNFKKGEKERLCEQLYLDFVKNDPRAKDPKQVNQAFIAILQEKLGMSKAGATTYNYNMKKKHGGDIVAKVRRV